MTRRIVGVQPQPKRVFEKTVSLRAIPFAFENLLKNKDLRKIYMTPTKTPYQQILEEQERLEGKRKYRK
jgi:hypothetical protein